MKNKAQAAMEFLMTYGWAILVLLAAVGSLAYFGVFAPDRFVPEVCILPSGVACLDSAASPSGMTLIIKNAAGFYMKNVSVSVAGMDTAGFDCSVGATGPTDLNNDQQGTYDVLCSLTSGTQYKGLLTVQYTNGKSGVIHTTTGDLIKQIP